MSVDISATTVIECPIGEVAGYSGDPSNAPTWYRRIDTADWQTDPPITLGSRIAFRAKFMGRQLDHTYEITEYTPGEQVMMRTTDGPFPIHTTYTWRAIGDSKTHMRLRQHGEPVGFSKLVAPFMAFTMKRAMTQDLKQLKTLLEG